MFFASTNFLTTDEGHGPIRLVLLFYGVKVYFDKYYRSFCYSTNTSPHAALLFEFILRFVSYSLFRFDSFDVTSFCSRYGLFLRVSSRLGSLPFAEGPRRGLVCIRHGLVCFEANAERMQRSVFWLFNVVLYCRY